MVSATGGPSVGANSAPGPVTNAIVHNPADSVENHRLVTILWPSDMFDHQFGHDCVSGSEQLRCQSAASRIAADLLSGQATPWARRPNPRRNAWPFRLATTMRIGPLRQRGHARARPWNDFEELPACS